MTEFLNEYSDQTGVVLEDDFVKEVQSKLFLDAYNYKYYYDFTSNTEWVALPYITDTRLVFFNKTTFDTLGLMYPPPLGNWSKVISIK